MMIEVNTVLYEELFQFPKVAVRGVAITEVKNIAFSQSRSNLVFRGTAIIVAVQGCAGFHDLLDELVQECSWNRAADMDFCWISIRHNHPPFHDPGSPPKDRYAELAPDNPGHPGQDPSFWHLSLSGVLPMLPGRYQRRLHLWYR